jgi:hypothetical protein
LPPGLWATELVTTIPPATAGAISSGRDGVVTRRAQSSSPDPRSSANTLVSVLPNSLPSPAPSPFGPPLCRSNMRRHRTLPVFASSAYTLLFSVWTKTVPSRTSVVPASSPEYVVGSAIGKRQTRRSRPTVVESIREAPAERVPARSWFGAGQAVVSASSRGGASAS